MFICSCSVMLCMDYFPHGKWRERVCVCVLLQLRVCVCFSRNVCARFTSVWLISASCWVLHLSPSPFLCVCLCVRILVNLPHRLQMENELRQREREQEREREKEREREAGLEREREREREREEERERERELERQKERQRERQQQMVRAAEGHYLAELHARRAPPEDRARPGERLTPNRLGTYTQTRVYMYVRSPAGACIQSFRNGFIFFLLNFS